MFLLTGWFCTHIVFFCLFSFILKSSASCVFFTPVHQCSLLLSVISWASLVRWSSLWPLRFCLLPISCQAAFVSSNLCLIVWLVYCVFIVLSFVCWLLVSLQCPLSLLLVCFVWCSPTRVCLFGISFFYLSYSYKFCFGHSWFMKSPVYHSSVPPVLPALGSVPWSLIIFPVFGCKLLTALCCSVCVWGVQSVDSQSP